MSEAAEFLADLRGELALSGEDLKLRRFTGETLADTTVRGKSMAMTSDPVAGSAQSADRKFVLIAEGAILALLPLTVADCLVRGSKQMRIKRIDDEARRVAGTLIGLEIWVNG